MNMRWLAVAAVAMECGTALAALTVEEKDGAFRVLRDGKPVIERLMVDLGGGGVAKDLKRSYAEKAGVGKVWNVWSEEPDFRHRLEVVERTDGAVELTLAGQAADGPTPYRARRLYVFAPIGVFDGRAYDALQGNGRAWKPTNGTFDGAFRRDSFRWLACDGLVWDFNPIGAGNYCNQYPSSTIQGVWSFIRQGGKRHYEIASGGASGGYTGTKLVLREGRNEDYFKYHHLKSFHYNQPCFAKHAVAFGAPKFGKSYENGDVSFDVTRGFGWVGDVRRELKVGNPSGAYYSHAAGRGPAVYRFAGLSDGFYVFTLQAGNWTGERNRFSVTVNGTELGTDLSVEKRRARTVSRTVRVTGGTADVTLTGDWIVSALAVQPLMADGEDFSVRRGLWATDGYEPGILYRSCDFARPMHYPVLDETIDMPPPGRESAGKAKTPPTPARVPAKDDPAFAWLKRAKTYSFAGNASALCFPKEGPGSVEDLFRRDADGMDYNVVFASGLHSRHTYVGHVGRSVKAMGEIAKSAHKRGMKLVDHHDATLFWNEMAGFRAMMSRLPETIRSVHDNLPSFQMCPNNPTFNEKYLAYLRALVEAGVDGFQIDEVVFWAHGCACRHCREKFHAETGWWLPLDETDATFSDFRSPIARRWHDWKSKTIANWFVNLKDYVKDVKPDLVLLMYTTHWGFVASGPQYGLTNDLLEQGRVINYFGTEVMTRNPIQSSRSLMPYRRMMNLFTLTYGSPVWGIFYGATAEGDYLAWSISNMLGQGALLHSRPAGKRVDFSHWGVSDLNMKLSGASQVVETALLFSSHSRDWNSGVPFIEEEFGLAQGLEAIHVPYEFVCDSGLTSERLSKYKVLCLGASLCMSDAEVAAVKAFLAGGGTVFTAVEAGRCNEFGEPREAWPFADAKGRFVYRPDMRAAAFCAREAELNREWTFNPDRAAEKAYRDKLAEVMAPGAYWKVSAPETVFTTIWTEADGTAAVHFVNAGGACLKPGELITFDLPKVPFPAISEDIVFTIPAKNVRRVTAASPEFSGVRDLPFRSNDDGTVSVTVPKGLFLTYVVVKLN